jgi:hypothetical protein
MNETFYVSVSLAALSGFGCLSPDERDLNETGGAAGTAGVAGNAAGASGGSSGGSAGTTGGNAMGGSAGQATGGSAMGGSGAGAMGGSAGQATGGTGMVSGAGGGAGSGAAAGTNPGSGGSGGGMGGSANAGAAGTETAGQGGSSNAGTGGSAMGGAGMAGSSGSGACVENLGCTLEPPPSTGDPYQDCVDRINQFRTECACLPPLERWTDGEMCADEMAEYDSTRTAHAGFADGICEGGSAQNECPGWGSSEQVIDGCLQAMWAEGPPPQEPCDGQCFQDHGHYINMTNERYTQVACGFFETGDGEVWAVQNFTR